MPTLYQLLGISNAQDASHGDEEELRSLVAGSKTHDVSLPQHGYDNARLHRLIVSIDGMHCSSCSSAVEDAVRCVCWGVQRCPRCRVFSVLFVSLC